jgi:hypothetical protein
MQPQSCVAYAVLGEGRGLTPSPAPPLLLVRSRVMLREGSRPAREKRPEGAAPVFRGGNNRSPRLLLAAGLMLSALLMGGSPLPEVARRIARPGCCTACCP